VGGLAIVFTSLNLCVLTLALMLVALCRSVEQLDATGTALTDLFGAVGGALVPSFILPSLVEDIAPATPVYWAVDASRAVILEGEGISAVLGPSAVLLGFAAVFGLVASTRFRFAEPKFVEAG
jgi:ABC-2 type transport system permease protein